MSRSIKALIVDDHRLVLIGLRMVLEKGGIEVVGEAMTGRDAVELARATEPDVMILDIFLPDIDGLEILRKIVRLVPTASVIMTSGTSDLSYAKKALRMGATGYLTKDEGPEGILAAIRSVVKGEAAVSRSILFRALKEGEDLLAEFSRPPDLDGGLTPQQLKVAALVGRGLDNSEIARELDISVNTVRRHVQEVYIKLGLADRTKVALWAVRNGLTG